MKGVAESPGSETDDSFEPLAPLTEDVPAAKSVPRPPIFSILDSIDFSGHFVLLGDVGTGKSTVVPIHEFESAGRTRTMLIREPSRASCNALYYSLSALHPKVKDELAVITKDTKVNTGGRVKIVTDGVLLRMLAEGSVKGASIYFDESHQMTSQLELCMSLAKKQEQEAGNLFRVMSATIDPAEFLSFLGIRNLYSVSGRRFPVGIETVHARDLDGMFDALVRLLHTRPRGESWLVFLPTRRVVEKYARSGDGVYIHGGLDGSEVNRIQKRAETDRSLKVFATNVIASSVNIYLDNVLIFNDAIESKDSLGRKALRYGSIDNNTLLQMIGRIGRFKPGKAVIISDTPVPRDIKPTAVKKALEFETPFDLVLLMSKYGLKFSELELMSKVSSKEVAFAENWLVDIGAIHPLTQNITRKGILMSEIPYDPDFAHMVASAIVKRDYLAARFFLACGAFGDSLNHAYKTDFEVQARQFLYAFDNSNELNIKAHLLKRYSDDKGGAFADRLASNGIFPRFIEEAHKNYNAARDSLNDVLESSNQEPLPEEVAVDPDVRELEPYFEECLSFERFHEHEKREHDLRNLYIGGPFYARTLTVNFRTILYDVVALDRRKNKKRHR